MGRVVLFPEGGVCAEPADLVVRRTSLAARICGLCAAQLAVVEAVLPGIESTTESNALDMIRVVVQEDVAIIKGQLDGTFLGAFSDRYDRLGPLL